MLTFLAVVVSGLDNVYITGDLYWSKVVALRSPSRVVRVRET